MPGYDCCGEQRKVESELMCLFIEKLSKLKNKYAAVGQKSAKELYCDNLRNGSTAAQWLCYQGLWHYVV